MIKQDRYTIGGWVFWGMLVLIALAGLGGALAGCVTLPCDNPANNTPGGTSTAPPDNSACAAF